MADRTEILGLGEDQARGSSRVAADAAAGFVLAPPVSDAECSLHFELSRIAAETPRSSLAVLIGALAHAQAVALARLLTPAAEPPDEAADTLLTMPEVARRLGVTEHQARELGRRGELPTVTVGERLVRVRGGALVEWIRRRESGRNIETRTGR